MQAPSSRGRLRTPPDFFPSSGPHNCTITTGHPSSIPAGGRQANTRRDHDRIPMPNLPPNGIPTSGNSYASNTSVFSGPQGELEHPIWQEDMENAPLVQSEPETQRPKSPGKLLPHAKVVHSSETYARIHRLSKREQGIVLTDGGNNAESQLLVLDTIEQYPADDNNRRVWDEVLTSLPSGKKTIEYNCKAPGCGYRDRRFQKARQHFVSRHVAEACWGCPIEGCTHTNKYKRLDDLKHHHMVSAHGVEYTRNRKRDVSEFPTGPSTPGQAIPHPTNITSSHTDDQTPTIATISNPSQLLDRRSTSTHVPSQAERGPRKARVARLKASVALSQVGRSRIGRVRVTPDRTSGHSHAMPVGAEISSLDVFRQDTNSLGVATPVPVYTDALSPHNNSQQMSPWPNYLGSPTHLGAAPTENAFTLDALDFTYPQTTNAPPGPPLDSGSVYAAQMYPYGELSVPNAPQQGTYGNSPMPYMSSPLRTQPDLRGMAPNHTATTLSPQGAIDVGGHLRGQVTDGSRMSSQGMSNDQVNHMLDALLFDAALHPTSPGTQPLTPGHHQNQWEQTGAGLLTGYSYNQPHPLSSPINMSSTQSPSGYIGPSQPMSHTLGALSSGVRHQAVSSAPYAQAQRVSRPTHGFAENRGYLSAQTFPSSHGVGILSPTQGTMYQDRFGNQTPREPMMMYTAATFDGFETSSPNFGWSPQSEYSRPTLSPNLQSNVSSNSYLQGTSQSISGNNVHFIG